MEKVYVLPISESWIGKTINLKEFTDLSIKYVNCAARTIFLDVNNNKIVLQDTLDTHTIRDHIAGQTEYITKKINITKDKILFSIKRLEGKRITELPHPPRQTISQRVALQEQRDKLNDTPKKDCGCGGPSGASVVPASGSTDPGSTDSGSNDSGSNDSGSNDSGSIDSGSTEAGSTVAAAVIGSGDRSDLGVLNGSSVEGLELQVSHITSDTTTNIITDTLVKNTTVKTKRKPRVTKSLEDGASVARESVISSDVNVIRHSLEDTTRDRINAEIVNKNVHTLDKNVHTLDKNIKTEIVVPKRSAIKNVKVGDTDIIRLSDNRHLNKSSPNSSSATWYLTFDKGILVLDKQFMTSGFGTNIGHHLLITVKFTHPGLKRIIGEYKRPDGKSFPGETKLSLEYNVHTR